MVLFILKISPSLWSFIFPQTYIGIIMHCFSQNLYAATQGGGIIFYTIYRRKLMVENTHSLPLFLFPIWSYFCRNLTSKAAAFFIYEGRRNIFHYKPGNSSIFTHRDIHILPETFVLNPSREAPSSWNWTWFSGIKNIRGSFYGKPVLGRPDFGLLEPILHWTPQKQTIEHRRGVPGYLIFTYRQWCTTMVADIFLSGCKLSSDTFWIDPFFQLPRLEFFFFPLDWCFFNIFPHVSEKPL